VVVQPASNTSSAAANGNTNDLMDTIFFTPLPQRVQAFGSGFRFWPNPPTDEQQHHCENTLRKTPPTTGLQLADEGSGRDDRQHGSDDESLYQRRKLFPDALGELGQEQEHDQRQDQRDRDGNGRSEDDPEQHGERLHRFSSLTGFYALEGAAQAL
jgi:hypothetical protein